MLYFICFKIGTVYDDEDHLYQILPVNKVQNGFRKKKRHSMNGISESPYDSDMNSHVILEDHYSLSTQNMIDSKDLSNKLLKTYGK